MLKKAQGCFIGLIAGDNLGSLVEFKSPQRVAQLYPQGFKDLLNGGSTYHLRAGQPTDDGELAITLARTIIEHQEFNRHEVLKAYQEWANSNPFDIGDNTSYALVQNRYNASSISNGSLMRIAPIGIYGTTLTLDEVAKLAIQDSQCTHKNPVVFEVNSIYARAISLAIKSEMTAQQLFDQMEKWATLPIVQQTIAQAKIQMPQDMSEGTCLVSFQNAMYHLLHTTDIIKAMDMTIRQGGDSDTHAAILGALFGALYGIDIMPQQWIDAIVSCESVVGKTGEPRDPEYWPVDVLTLAEKLISLKKPQN